MRIEYKTDADEAAETVSEWTRQSAWFHRQRVRSLIGFATASTFVGLYVTMRDLPLATASGISVAMASVLTTVWWLTYPLIFATVGRARIRRYMRTVYGREPFWFVAEARESGLAFEQQAVKAELPWTALRNVRQTDHGVELWFEKGLVRVATRGFAGAQHQREFVDAVLRFRTNAAVK